MCHSTPYKTSCNRQNNSLACYNAGYSTKLHFDFILHHVTISHQCARNKQKSTAMAWRYKINSQLLSTTSSPTSFLLSVWSHSKGAPQQLKCVSRLLNSLSINFLLCRPSSYSIYLSFHVKKQFCISIKYNSISGVQTLQDAATSKQFTWFNTEAFIMWKTIWNVEENS